MAHYTWLKWIHQAARVTRVQLVLHMGQDTVTHNARPGHGSMVSSIQMVPARVVMRCTFGKPTLLLHSLLHTHVLSMGSTRAPVMIAVRTVCARSQDVTSIPTI